MAARLSILGLPVGDNILCRLLLGLAVIVASCSKPMVAAFGTAAKQDDQCVAIFGEVDPVTWPPVDDVFTHAIKPLDAGCYKRTSANGLMGCGIGRLI
jgi:hypothetical protein